MLPAAPVGASDQWSDDTDATYCDLYAQNIGPVTGVSTTLASADFTSVSGVVTQLLARCRVELLVAEVVGEQKFGILFPTSEGNLSPDRQDIAGGANVTEGLVASVPTWVEFDLSADPIASRIADGVTIMFGTRFAPTGTLDPVAMYRVYEVALVVTTRTGAPPLRKYPRSDGRGVGPRRHWPRSVNRRVGGSY